MIVERVRPLATTNTGNTAGRQWRRHQLTVGTLVSGCGSDT